MAAVGCSVKSSDDASDDAGGDSSSTTEAKALGETRGVTDDSVALGVAAVTSAQLKSLGIEVTMVDPEALFTALVDHQNTEGGAAGRQIDLNFRAFVPYIDTEAQAACVALTEDTPSFVVIGMFLDDTSLCITETHETPYIGMWGLSEERAARSVGPFLAMEMSDENQRVNGIEALADQGAFDGKTVGLYWQAPDDAVVESTIKPLLDERGIDVVVEAPVDDFGTDQTANDAALDTTVEVLRSADPDIVLNVSDFASLLTAFERKGWAPDQVFATSQQALSADVLTNTGVSPELLSIVTVATPFIPDKDELLADQDLQDCIEVFNASSPEEPIDLDTIDAESLKGVGYYCSAFDVFVQAADAAGDDLTQETWLAGAESLGDLVLPAIPYGSLGPSKHDVGDAVGIYTFDPAAGRMVIEGQPIDTSK